MPRASVSPQPPVPHARHPSVPGSRSVAPGSQQPAKADGPPATALGDATEPPFWACVCDVNAVVLMCVNIFCFAYFA